MRPLPFLITCLCIVCFAGSPIPARTQDRQDYHFRYVTLDSLVKVVEKKTGYRFYYSKNQTDTLLLSVRSRQEEIIPALNRALQEAGVGPVEIARRLGVSRMTVWRKLRALETAQLS